jgi:uncharacterized protein (TIGR02452 family)
MVDLCEYLVYARRFNLEEIINSDPFFISHRDKIHFMQVEDEDLEEVSSTELRRRFFAGEDYRPLMNEGPYRIFQQLSPSDFPAINDEDMIRANILYGGRFGMNSARMCVFNANAKIFKAWPSYLGNKDEHLCAKAYTSAFTVDVPKLETDTVTGCANADCVDVAKTLLDEGLNPAILNLASAKRSSGGYREGMGAQEESLCRSSNLSLSLYQYADHKYINARESGVPQKEIGYPLNLNYGGIYTPNVTFFRNNRDKFYTLRDTTFKCDVITVAGLSFNGRSDYAYADEMSFRAEDGGFTPEGEEIMLNKIRTIFRMGVEHGNDSIVSGALGCGAYALLPSAVAPLFRVVMEEPEFKNKFRLIVFAILERPRRPQGFDGHFAPFYQEFGTFTID